MAGRVTGIKVILCTSFTGYHWTVFMVSKDQNHWYTFGEVISEKSPFYATCYLPQEGSLYIRIPKVASKEEIGFKPGAP